jgi:tight adherence protein B
MTRTTLVRKNTLSDIPWLNRWLEQQPWIAWLKRFHAQSGTRAPLAIYLLASVLLASGAFALAEPFRFPVVARLVLALVSGTIPLWLLVMMRSRRIVAFQRQLPEGLDLIARALKAGHAFFVGMKIVGDELAEPIGPEFRRAYDEVTVGVSVPDALQALAGRVECTDVRYFVAAVSIQRETGGNLAEILEGLGTTIRKRFELQEKVTALAAEGVLSAVVLFCLPIVLGIIFYSTNPLYFAVLFTDPLGQAMVSTGALLMLIGAVVTRNLIKIEA